METITIPKYEYFSILALFKEMKHKIEILSDFQQIISDTFVKPFDANKYCGALSLKGDALQIQKEMRDEWN